MTKSANSSNWQDLAWKWFEYHATQRTTMFNYFLIIIGILAAAFVSSIDGEYANLQLGLAFSGIVLAIIFLLLDVRNEQLIDLAEEAIAELERTAGFRPAGSSSRIFSSEQVKGAAKGPKPWYRWSWFNPVSHKCLVRAVHLLVAAAFALALYFPEARGDAEGAVALSVAFADGRSQELICGPSASAPASANQGE